MSRTVFVTDIHLTEGRGGPDAFGRDLVEIVALEPRPDLVVFGGDICLWEPGAGDALADLLRGFSLPAVHLMGNHDTSPERPLAEFDRDFTERFGPRNAHVDLGDAHVIALNTCRLAPEHEDWHNVVGQVVDDDLEWLNRTLSSIPDRSMPLLVFVHIPLASTYPERRGATDADRAAWRVANGDEVIRRLARRPACVVGQGHLHENEHLHRRGVHLVSVGSVCGSWWRQGAASRCVDGSPRGWLVADVAGGEVELSYRAARAPADRQGEIVERDGTRWLDLFFGDPSAPVDVEVDGAWVGLDSPLPVAVDDTFTTTHHWPLPVGVRRPRLRVRTRMRSRPWEFEVSTESTPIC